jgi:predicted metal-dependent HD superfamily phosphohydrolase
MNPGVEMATTIASLIEKLRATTVDWDPSNDSRYIFQTNFENMLVQLRLNDFPAEPLCTVIIGPQEVELTDLTEFPPGWKLPPPDMRGTWIELLDVWAVDHRRAEQKFNEVSAYYNQPERFYHTFEHIHHVVSIIGQLASVAKHSKHPNAVKLAGWLHDVVYDSKASDNEERSAEYARRLCEDLSIPDGDLVARLIAKTKTHEAGLSENERRSREHAEWLCKKMGIPQGTARAEMLMKARYFEPDEIDDAQVLIDADLAVLGASQKRYETYSRQIRLEYAWVPDTEYRRGRQRVLETFLGRPKLYHFLTILEGRARRNLSNELRQLS